jgi:hypothetical protein
MTDILLSIFLFLIPWAMGVVLIINIIVEGYRTWLWKGMDKEARYEWIKICKW